MGFKVKVYSAPWCVVCGPYKDALKRQSIEFEEVNVEESPEISHQMQIRSLPTTVVYSESEEVQRYTGNSVANLVKFLNKE